MKDSYVRAIVEGSERYFRAFTASSQLFRFQAKEMR